MFIKNSSEIIDAFDPQGKIIHRLFRDSTTLENGEYVKDMALMNRDPSKMIFIDCNAASCSRQPENSLVLDKWDGEVEDKVLFDLASFLKSKISLISFFINAIFKWWHFRAQMMCGTLSSTTKNLNIH